MTDAGLDFGTLWGAAGVIAGFSVTVLIFRIGRETEMRARGEPYWFPPADFLLLGSLAVVLVGVFVLPVLGAGLAFGQYALGWAFLLLAGYPFAIVGHYDILFGEVRPMTAGRRAESGFPWKTGQEAVVLVLVAVASLAYFVAVAAREAS